LLPALNLREERSAREGLHAIEASAIVDPREELRAREKEEELETFTEHRATVA